MSSAGLDLKSRLALLLLIPSLVTVVPRSKVYGHVRAAPSKSRWAECRGRAFESSPVSRWDLKSNFGYTTPEEFTHVAFTRARVYSRSELMLLNSELPSISFLIRAKRCAGSSSINQYVRISPLPCKRARIKHVIRWRNSHRCCEWRAMWRRWGGFTLMGIRPRSSNR